MENKKYIKKPQIKYKNPYEIIIEISKGSSVKYEYEDGKLKVDRFLNVPFVYPFNYGYIPFTMGRDNDPLDAVVLCDPLIPGSLINCKLIGALETADENGEDNKFIFVPINKVSNRSKHIDDLDDLSIEELNKIDGPKKILIHINNSNPILNEKSYERKILSDNQIDVSFDGMEISL